MPLESEPFDNGNGERKQLSRTVVVGGIAGFCALVLSTPQAQRFLGDFGDLAYEHLQRFYLDLQ